MIFKCQQHNITIQNVRTVCLVFVPFLIKIFIQIRDLTKFKYRYNELQLYFHLLGVWNLYILKRCLAVSSLFSIPNSI